MMACLVVTPYRPHPTFGTSRVGPIVSRVTLQDDSRTATADVTIAHRVAQASFGDAYHTSDELLDT